MTRHNFFTLRKVMLFFTLPYKLLPSLESIFPTFFFLSWLFVSSASHREGGYVVVISPHKHQIFTFALSPTGKGRKERGGEEE